MRFVYFDYIFTGAGSKRSAPRPPPEAEGEFEVDSDEDNRDFNKGGTSRSNKGNNNGNGRDASHSEAGQVVMAAPSNANSSSSLGESKVDLDLSNMREFVTNPGKYSKRRRSNVAVMIARVFFISSFLFYCLLCNHSFPTNPNRITNCFQLILSIYNFTTTFAQCVRLFLIF